MDTSQCPPPNDPRHEGDLVPHVSKDPQTTEQARPEEFMRDPNAECDSPEKDLCSLLGLPPVTEIGPDTSQCPAPNDRPRTSDVVLAMSKDPPAAEAARSGEPVRDPIVQRDSLDQRIAMAREAAREGPEFTAQYRQWSRSSLGLPVEPFVVVPKELPATKEAPLGAPARGPNATRNSSPHSIGMGRQGFEPPPGLRAMEASMRMSPRPPGVNDQFASDMPSTGRRLYRRVARFFIMVLIAAFIGVAARYWQSHGDKTVKLVRTYALSIGLLTPERQSRGAEPAPQQSAPLTQKPATAAASSSPELVEQLEAMARDLTAVRHQVEQLAATQEQMTHNIASLQAGQQEIGQKKSAPPLSAAVHLPPATQEQMTHIIASRQAGQQDIGQKSAPPLSQAVHLPPATHEQMTHNTASPQAGQPDTRQKKSAPLTPALHLPPPKNTPGVVLRQPPPRKSILADWSVTDGPRDGWVYVQGHGDVYRVVPGTPLPGLGPVEQIKGQDGHWVVITPKGIIVSRRGPMSGGGYDVLDRDVTMPTSKHMKYIESKWRANSELPV